MIEHQRLGISKLLLFGSMTSVRFQTHNLNINFPYVNLRMKLCLNQWETDIVETGRGVRQECCMLPTLFNLYGVYLIKEA
jgi:hypothetical protein